jgi:hypothetical protein
MNAPQIPTPGQEPPMGEVSQSTANAPASLPPGLPRRLFRWCTAHPATVAWLSLIALGLVVVLLTFVRFIIRLPDFVGDALLILLLTIVLVSVVWGLVAVFRERHRPIRERVFQGLSLLLLPAVLVVIAHTLMSAGRRPPAARAANDAKTAVNQAIVYANDHGVYPTSLKVLRDSGYANVLDQDMWGRPFILAPILSEGRKSRNEDDVYIYSKGSCGTGTYQPGKPYTGKCGAVGYSSTHEKFIGQDP